MNECERMITGKLHPRVRNQSSVKAKLICLHCVVSIYLRALLSYLFLNKQMLNEFTTIAQTVLGPFVSGLCYEWWLRLTSTNQSVRPFQNRRSPPGWYLKANMANADILNSAPFNQEEERRSAHGSLIDSRGESCRSCSNGNGRIGEDGRDRLK